MSMNAYAVATLKNLDLPEEYQYADVSDHDCHAIQARSQGGSMSASAPPFLKLEKFKSLPTSAGVFYHSRFACNPKFCSSFNA